MVECDVRQWRICCICATQARRTKSAGSVLVLGCVNTRSRGWGQEGSCCGNTTRKQKQQKKELCLWSLHTKQKYYFPTFFLLVTTRLFFQHWDFGPFLEFWPAEKKKTQWNKIQIYVSSWKVVSVWGLCGRQSVQENLSGCCWLYSPWSWCEPLLDAVVVVGIRSGHGCMPRTRLARHTHSLPDQDCRVPPTGCSDWLFRVEFQWAEPSSLCLDEAQSSAAGAGQPRGSRKFWWENVLAPNHPTPPPSSIFPSFRGVFSDRSTTRRWEFFSHEGVDLSKKTPPFMSQSDADCNFLLQLQNAHDAKQLSHKSSFEVLLTLPAAEEQKQSLLQRSIVFLCMHARLCTERAAWWWDQGADTRWLTAH